MNNRDRVFISLLCTATVTGFGGTLLAGIMIIQSLSRSPEDAPGLIALPFMVPGIGMGCTLLTLIVGFPIGWGLKRLRRLNGLTASACGAALGAAIGVWMVGGQMANEGDEVVKLTTAIGTLSAFTTYAVWARTGRRKAIHLPVKPSP